MSTTTSTDAGQRTRGPGPRQDDEIVTRLRKATGQLSGVASMVDNGRYCIDVLDQLSAVTAAIDAVAVLVGLVAVVAVWGLSMRLVGQVAEEFGEDPARWRLLSW